MKKILSLDGGGIRGLIPALLIAEMEKRTGKRCAEMFDMIAGTSTGGILALAFSVHEDNKPKYSALDLADIYAKQGKDIFKRSYWKGVSSVGGTLDEKYSAAGLEAVLTQYLGDLKLKDGMCNTLVTSYDIENREPYFFKSWDERCRDVPMALAGRATSAAPTYFEPINANINGKIRTFVDGGVFVNNPAVSAYAEAKRIYPGEEILVISLGTGELIRPIPYEDAKDWGMAEWALPVMSCMFDGVSDAVNYQMWQILGDNFIRLQTTLTIASDDMDNATNGNIQCLKMEVAKILDENKDAFNKIINLIA